MDIIKDKLVTVGELILLISLPVLFVVLIGLFLTVPPTIHYFLSLVVENGIVLYGLTGVLTVVVYGMVYYILDTM